MATKAFQKIYTKITQITKATCSLKAMISKIRRQMPVEGRNGATRLPNAGHFKVELAFSTISALNWHLPSAISTSKWH